MLDLELADGRAHPGDYSAVRLGLVAACTVSLLPLAAALAAVLLVLEISPVERPMRLDAVQETAEMQEID